MSRYLGITLVLLAFASVACSELGGDEPDDTMAYVMCQDFVKDRLKAPASAGFPLMHEATIKENGSEQWQIRSHVDSENSFGANIRSFYDCEIKFVGNDKWQLVSLDFDD